MEGFGKDRNLLGRRRIVLVWALALVTVHMKEGAERAGSVSPVIPPVGGVWDAPMPLKILGVKSSSGRPL